jgi:hypothetical protein
MRRTAVLLLVWSGLACRASTPSGVPVVALPNGRPGIGFDDLRYSRSLGKLLVPGGRSGKLDLIDPSTRGVTSIDGFSEGIVYFGGHDEGATSADDGRGYIFVTDRTTQKLSVVDPQARKIVGSVALGGSPDYVRFVDPTSELWVTQPNSERIEIFAVSSASPPVLTHTAYVTVSGGPESLIVDPQAGRAYTHLWNGASVAIDVRTRAVGPAWSNGCQGSRGIALDAGRGVLFAACAEGGATTLDTATGSSISHVKAASGVDVVDYSSTLGHLYLSGADSENVAVVAVSKSGQLSVAGTLPGVSGGHCVAADDRGNAYVCDPSNGDLLVLRDPFPSSGT